jgi:phage shock protein A
MLAEQISVAVQQGRDELAEVAIAQQMDIEAQLPILERTLTDGATQAKELEVYITALQGKRREMQEALAGYASTQQPARHSEQTATVSALSLDAKLDQASAAFDRALENATGIPGRQHSMDVANAVQWAELEELSRQHRIQERLAAIQEGSIYRAIRNPHPVLVETSSVIR